MTDHKMTTTPDYPAAQTPTGDLPSRFAELRAMEPVSRARLPNGDLAWLVTRHADVQTVLSDPRFTRDLRLRDGPQALTHDPRGEIFAADIRTVNTDGPPHVALRRLVSKAFTVRRVAALRPRVQKLADELLDAMELEGAPADLISGFAHPLPAIVICELLGVPTADRDRFTAWSDRITSVSTFSGDEIAGAWRDMNSYFADLIEVKRRQAGDDLLSALIAAHDKDDKLTNDELKALAIVVLVGGHETTSVAIAAGLVRLFRHPDQLARLRADPNLITSAVEELLRYQPVINLNRLQVATEDVLLADTLIRRGEAVQIAINSANRDESVFSESESLDIARDPNPHLTFGNGAHYCLGVALARLELEVAFATLLRRFPTLRAAIPLDQLRWRMATIKQSRPHLPGSADVQSRTRTSHY